MFSLQSITEGRREVLSNPESAPSLVIDGQAIVRAITRDNCPDFLATLTSAGHSYTVVFALPCCIRDDRLCDGPEHYPEMEQLVSLRRRLTSLGANVRFMADDVPRALVKAAVSQCSIITDDHRVLYFPGVHALSIHTWRDPAGWLAWRSDDIMIPDFGPWSDLSSSPYDALYTNPAVAAWVAGEEVLPVVVAATASAQVALAAPRAALSLRAIAYGLAGISHTVYEGPNESPVTPVQGLGDIPKDTFLRRQLVASFAAGEPLTVTETELLAALSLQTIGSSIPREHVECASRMVAQAPRPPPPLGRELGIRAAESLETLQAVIGEARGIMALVGLGAYAPAPSDLVNEQLFADLTSGPEPVSLWGDFTLPNNTENILQTQLPVLSQRQEIVNRVSNNPITAIINGAGCGKSTQVPQYLMDSAITTRILVTAPTVFAAQAMARRVAAERGPEGAVFVASWTNPDVPPMRDARLIWCTPRCAIAALSYDTSFTHIIADEIHSRTIDMDLLLLSVRKVVQMPNAPRCVLMTSTPDMSLILEYFGASVSLVDLGDRRPFPLECVYLRGLSQHGDAGGQLAGYIRKFDHAAATANKQNMSCELPPFIFEYVSRLIVSIAEPGGSVLVFMAGIDEIDALQDRLTMTNGADALEIVSLHERTAAEEAAALLAPRYTTARVVLTTSFAESSVTIPGTHAVIDFGRRKDVEFNNSHRCTCISTNWVSRDSIAQRAARTGRTCAGRVYRLLTERFEARYLAPHAPADVLKESLERVVLRCCSALPQIAVTSVVEELPSLPQSRSSARGGDQSTADPGAVGKRVADVCRRLTRQGILTSDFQVTSFGRLAFDFPIDVHLLVVLFTGVALGCVPEAVVLAAALSVPDTFILPNPSLRGDQPSYNDLIARTVRGRIEFDCGHLSEPVCCLNVFLAFQMVPARESRTWAYHKGLSFKRLGQLQTTVRSLAFRLSLVLPSKRHMLNLLCQPRVPAPELEKLFRASPQQLRLIITAAMPNKLLTAIPRRIPRNDPEGMFTVTLIDVPRAYQDPTVLSEALSMAGPFEDVQVDQEGRATLYFASSSSDCNVLHDVPLGVRILRQMAGRDRVIHLGSTNTFTGEPVTARVLPCDGELQWTLAQKKRPAHPNRDTLLACACELRPSVNQVFGLASQFIGMNDGKSFRAVGITVLPASPSIVLVHLLIFSRCTTWSLLRVTAQGSAPHYVAATTHASSMDPIEGFVLLDSHLATINSIRSAMSSQIRNLDEAGTFSLFPTVTDIIHQVYSASAAGAPQGEDEQRTWVYFADRYVQGSAGDVQLFAPWVQAMGAAVNTSEPAVLLPSMQGPISVAAGASVPAPIIAPVPTHHGPDPTPNNTPVAGSTSDAHGSGESVPSLVSAATSLIQEQPSGAMELSMLAESLVSVIGRVRYKMELHGKGSLKSFLTKHGGFHVAETATGVYASVAPPDMLASPMAVPTGGAGDDPLTAHVVGLLQKSDSPLDLSTVAQQLVETLGRHGYRQALLGKGSLKSFLCRTTGFVIDESAAEPRISLDPNYTNSNLDEVVTALHTAGGMVDLRDLPQVVGVSLDVVRNVCVSAPHIVSLQVTNDGREMVALVSSASSNESNGASNSQLASDFASHSTSQSNSPSASPSNGRQESPVGADGQTTPTLSRRQRTRHKALLTQQIIQLLTSKEDHSMTMDALNEALETALGAAQAQQAIVSAGSLLAHVTKLGSLEVVRDGESAVVRLRLNSGPTAAAGAPAVLGQQRAASLAAKVHEPTAEEAQKSANRLVDTVTSILQGRGATDLSVLAQLLVDSLGRVEYRQALLGRGSLKSFLSRIAQFQVVETGPEPVVTLLARGWQGAEFTPLPAADPIVTAAVNILQRNGPTDLSAMAQMLVKQLGREEYRSGLSGSRNLKGVLTRSSLVRLDTSLAEPKVFLVAEQTPITFMTYGSRTPSPSVSASASEDARLAVTEPSSAAGAGLRMSAWEQAGRSWPSSGVDMWGATRDDNRANGSGMMGSMGPFGGANAWRT